MADEKPPEGGAAPDAAEAEYRQELAKRVRGDVEAMGIDPDKGKEEPKPDDEEKPEEEAPAEDAEEGASDSEEGAEDTGDGEDKPEEKGKYSKAFRALQKREGEIQQLKGQVLQYEREIKSREQKVDAGERELGQFIKNLQLDPFGTLMQAGLLNEDDAEYASKQLYYRSKAAAADPKSKLEAERLARERRMTIESQQTREEVVRLRREQEEGRRMAELKASEDAYVARFESTIESYKSKTPLLAQALEKNPARTRRELYEVANELSAAKKEYADPALVVLAWSKERKKLLADLGIKTPDSKPANKPNPNPPKSEKAPEKSSKSAQNTDDAKEAAYRKELAARLDGTWNGD